MQFHIFELSPDQRPQLLHQQINHHYILLTADIPNEGKVLAMPELSELQILHFRYEIQQRHSNWVQNVVIQLQVPLQVISYKVSATKVVIWSHYWWCFFLLEQLIRLGRSRRAIIFMHKRWIQCIIIPPPFLNPNQAIDFQHSRTFIPLGVQKDGVHLFHGYWIEEKEVRLVGSCSQWLPYLLRIDMDHLNRHLADILKTLLGCRICRQQRHLMPNIQQRLHIAKNAIRSCGLIVPRPPTDKVKDIHV